MGGPCVGPQSKGCWAFSPSSHFHHLLPILPPLPSRGPAPSPPLPTSSVKTHHPSQVALLIGPHGFGSMALPSCFLLVLVLDSGWGWETMPRYLLPSLPPPPRSPSLQLPPRPVIKHVLMPDPQAARYRAHGPTGETETGLAQGPGGLLEVQKLRPHPGLLSHNLHINQIPGKFTPTFGKQLFYRVFNKCHMAAWSAE